MNEKPKKLNALAVERATYRPAFSAAGKPKGNELRHERGLYLFISPTGAKSWRYQYRLNGRKIIVYGQYPEVSLREAEDLHTDARRLITVGQVPVVVNKRVIAKKEAAALGVDKRFRATARDWYREKLRAARKGGQQLSESWRSNTKRWLCLANAAFGNKPLADVDAPDVLALIKGIEAKGYPTTADYVRQTVSYVMAWGILNLRAPRGFNPAEAVRGAVLVPEKQHHAKLELPDIGPFINTVKNSEESEQAKLALLILLHTFPRRSELILTPWTEVGENAWTILDERMKMNRSHVVPLSTQVKAMFARLKELAGDSPWVFPSPKNPRRPHNVMWLSQVLNRLGYEGRFTPHGVRSTAASILADRGYSRDVVDAALAHAENDETRAAYFRNQYLEQRAEMNQRWSDLLDGLAAGGARVVPIRAAA